MMRWHGRGIFAVCALAACSGNDNQSATGGETEIGSAVDDGTDTGEGTDEADDRGEGTDTGNGSGGGVSAGDPPTKFDLGTVPDTPDGVACQGPGDGEPEFSYLWAANSTQGTISKIDTVTVQELGRYIVRPDANGSPSRTSVNLEGDVAVANRSGGVTKIYALEERCQESNGAPGIQTSTDSTFLPWGQEECVAWHTPMNYESQRPVAWTPGEFNPATCRYENVMVWTSGRVGQQTDVLLLDGETGVIADQVTLAGFPYDLYGIYGGAVDAEGNFWGTKLGGVVLVRVALDDLSYETWNVPTSGYGMTVDDEGYVWVCSSTFSRFDPVTETWQTGSGGNSAGCMAERGPDGLLWMGGGSQIVGVNRQTLAVETTFSVPSYGVSIDYHGYVWAVAYSGGAHRVDPTNGDVQSYNGLVGAYTYSDMTGYALANAGGGAPPG